jgi:hypothetical protein
MDKIDFENPQNVQDISRIALYEQLSALRDDPEKFQAAAENIRRAFIAEEKDERVASSLKKLQKEVDEVVRNNPDPILATAEVFRMMTHSFAKNVDSLVGCIEVEKTLKESVGKTKH